MSTIKHNSQLQCYRWPLGARPCGGSVRLRLSAPEGCVCTLRVWSDKGESKLPMALRGYMSGSALYEATLPLPEKPQLLWYYFIIQMGEETVWYGNNDEQLGGEGQRYSHQPPSFQLTVYDRGYQTPEWMHDGVLYQIFVDRFCDGGQPLLDRKPRLTTHDSWDELPNPYCELPYGSDLKHDFFGGNLRGVIQKLPYLRKLGVTVLYLNPIFEAQSNHKYDTGDYERVDPTFGTNEDFALLCREAKKLGMRVMLDGVFSHTGDNSVYFNRYGLYDSVGAYQSKDSPYAPWYHFDRFPDEYGCWWGFQSLPEVDENNPAYREFIIRGENSVAAQWIRRGASGWRLDVADELPDWFIEKIRAVMEQDFPDSFLLGEVWEDASTKVAYSRRRRYLLGRELHGVMNYPFRTALLSYLRDGDAAPFQEAMETLRDHYPPAAFYSAMNFLGTHDTPRVLTVLGADVLLESREERASYRLSPDELSRGLGRLRLAALVLFTFPGSPTVYYGDEAGMQGFEDPFNRGTYPWGGEDRDLLNWFRTLGRLRRDCLPLRRGGLQWLCASGPLLAYSRTWEEQRFTTAVNASLEPQTLTLPWKDEMVEDLLTGQRLTPKDGTLELTLPPLTGALLT